jgi:hypothetical protein
LLLNVDIILGRCTFLFCLTENETRVDRNYPINILASIDISKNASLVLRIAIWHRGACLSSMCSAVPVVSLANWSNYNILHIIINRKINRWLLHHLDLFLSNSIVISNHLLDVGLVTTIRAVGTRHIVVRVVMRVLLLLHGRLLASSSSFLGMSSVFARL